MTQTITTTAAPATMTLDEDLDFAIGALRDDCGIELLAADAEELLAAVGPENSDLVGGHLREVARIFDRRNEASGSEPPADWAAMSRYAQLKHLARYCDNDVRAKLEQIAEDLRILSLADAEMEAYRVGSISRGTLVERLEELAANDAGILAWLRGHGRYGAAWHDDNAECLSA